MKRLPTAHCSVLNAQCFVLRTQCPVVRFVYRLVFRQVKQVSRYRKCVGTIGKLNKCRTRWLQIDRPADAGKRKETEFRI